MKLFGFFRSSASYRVRIALNMKQLPYEQASIHLSKGQQFEAEFAALSPQRLVPVLEEGDLRLFQSLAIIEYLDEKFPHPPLLPGDAPGRQRVRSLAQQIACEIHPLNNVRVLNYLTNVLGVTEAEKLAWYAHWVQFGFEALEKRLSTERQTGRFCHGDVPGLADIALVPQVANANRFKVDLSPYPAILAINKACLALDAFFQAAPQNQPDAE
ncbi:MAG: maleylacetoacetate isomerase [Burkholderiales bacterium]